MASLGEADPLAFQALTECDRTARASKARAHCMNAFAVALGPSLERPDR